MAQEGAMKPQPNAKKVPDNPIERDDLIKKQADCVRKDMAAMERRLIKQTGPYPPGDNEGF